MPRFEEDVDGEDVEQVSLLRQYRKEAKFLADQLMSAVRLNVRMVKDDMQIIHRGACRIS